MELGPSVLDNIALAGNPAHVEDNVFKPLVICACQGVLLEEERNRIQDNPTFKDTDKTSLKAAYSGLVTFVIEVAKQDCNEENISSVLEECKFTQDKIKMCSKLILSQKSQLQLLLGKVGTSFPHIVDVDWRLDYHIKSHQLEKVNSAVYLISLKTEVPGEKELKQVQFSCSLEQLQDLVGKLKDATKSIERIAQV